MNLSKLDGRKPGPLVVRVRRLSDEFLDGAME